MTFLKSVVVKHGGVNVLRGHDNQTSAPSVISTGDFTSSKFKTVDELNSITVIESRNNSGYSETYLSDGPRKNAVHVAIFVYFYHHEYLSGCLSEDEKGIL